MDKNCFQSLILILATLCISPHAYGQGLAAADRTHELLLFEEIPEVVVAASKKAQSVEKAPATVYVITGEEIRERGYTCVLDALRDLPGMTWNPTVGNVSGTRPVIRGLSNIKHLKVMLNGMLLGDKGGSGFAWAEHMPVNGVERIEFILGPYAALYGRDSFGGVINIVTRKGEDIDGGIVSALYGEWDRRQASLVTGKKTGPWDLYFSLFQNYSRNGRDLAAEYPETFSRTARESATNPATGLPVEFAAGVSDDYHLFWNYTDSYLSLKHDCGLTLDFAAMRIVWPSSGTYGVPSVYAQSRDDAVKRDIINSKFTYTRATDFFTSVSAVHLQDWQLHGRLSYLDGGHKIFRSQTRAAQVEQNLMADLGERNSLLLGLSYENVSALGMTGSETVSSVMDMDCSARDQSLNFTNLTVQDEILVTEKITSVIGLMYENSNAYDDILLPRATVIYSLTDDTTVKLIYACGYMTPDLSYGNDQILSNDQAIKGNPNLDPEKLSTYEINVVHRIGKHAKLSASAFMNIVEDIILLVPNDTSPDAASFPFIYDNISKQETRGGELSLNWDATDKVDLFCSASYVEGYIEASVPGGRKMRFDMTPLAARYHVKGGLTVLVWEDRLNLFVWDSYLGRIDSPYGQTYGRYNILNLNLKTAPAFHKSWSLSLGLNNVLDRKATESPSEMSSLIGAPTIERRTWTATVSYRW